jgi:hypothetical protein
MFKYITLKETFLLKQITNVYWTKQTLMVIVLLTHNKIEGKYEKFIWTWTNIQTHK